MGRPIVYKILENILENDKIIDSELIEALMYRPSVAGMDKYDLYKYLGWLIEEYFRYVYGDKKHLTKEIEDMS